MTVGVWDMAVGFFLCICAFMYTQMNIGNAPIFLRVLYIGVLQTTTYYLQSWYLVDGVCTTIPYIFRLGGSRGARDKCVTSHPGTVLRRICRRANNR